MRILTKILQLNSSTKLSNTGIFENSFASQEEREDVLNDLTKVLMFRVIRNPVLSVLMNDNSDLVNNYMSTLESLCRNRVNERVKFSSSTVADIQKIMKEVEENDYSKITEEHTCIHNEIDILVKQGLMLFQVVMQLKLSHENKDSEDETVTKVLDVFNQFFFSYQSFETRNMKSINTNDLLLAVKEHKYLMHDYCLDSYFNSLRATFNHYNAHNILSTISRLK